MITQFLVTISNAQISLQMFLFTSVAQWLESLLVTTHDDTIFNDDFSFQAEKQNGKTFHGGTIEFKDPEKNQTTKTGIYDEIPADKQNGKGAQPVAKESLNKDPVYSKPLKRTANNTVTKANPEPSSGASEKGSLACLVNVGLVF